MSTAKKHLKTTTLSSKGQITVSSEARKLLGIDKGDHLMEVVMDGCVLYIRADSILDEILHKAQSALERSGVKVSDLQEGVAARKAKKLRERYPGL
jgi:bifunctional DNA-binding transcriptional regulator/antitoxin component of YhaV-PrlF toxin-antitoxin module